MSAAVLALLLADSRTPTGGYAHSAGLEPAVAAGLTGAEVPTFLAARLKTVAYVEASFAAASCAEARRLLPLRGGKVDAHLALDDELAARTPSALQRSGLRQLGRALLRVGERLCPGDPVLEEYLRTSAWTPRPVALGLLAARAGLAPRETARLSLYEDAAGAAAAAVKLLPLDPAETTAWVAASAERIDELAAAAAREVKPPTAHAAAAHSPPSFAAIGPPTAQAAAASPPFAAAVLGREAPSGAALPATSTPLFDLRSLDHERLPGRHFVT